MIRPARPGDREGLLDLWEALMQNGRAADPGYATTLDARQHMRAFVDSTWFQQQPFPHALVAHEDGSPKLIGFVTAYPVARIPVVALEPTVRIGDLFVVAEHRRSGLGRRLVAEVLERTAAAGFPRAEVGTLTADSRAVGFWKAVGFGDWQVTLARAPTALPADLRIRRAVVADADALTELYAALMKHGRTVDPRVHPLPDEQRQRFRTSVSSAFFNVPEPFPRLLVAETDGGLVGFVQGEPNGSQASLLQLYVVPTLRRRGLGRALAQRFVDGVKAAGMLHVELDALFVDPSSRAFWRSMGFREFTVGMVLGPDQAG